MGRLVAPRPALVALIACTSLFAPALAMADDGACIAASEAELPLRKQGKLHDALKQLAVCADASCPDEVKTECAQRIAEINAAMPTLILSAKDGAGNDLADVKVSIDGEIVAGSLDGRPLAIEPGSHTLTFEALGQPPVEKKIVVHEGEKDRLESVVVGPVLPPAPAVQSSPAPAPPPLPQEHPWPLARTLGVVGGSVGLLGVGAGIWFGLFAVSSQNRQKSDCPSPTSCPNQPQANEDYNTAKKDATASTVAFAVGGTLLAAGVVSFLLAPSATARPAKAGRLRVVPNAAARGATITLSGEF